LQEIKVKFSPIMADIISNETILRPPQRDRGAATYYMEGETTNGIVI
jgi:hypothetical protein